jgi:hypothetical protein
MAKRMTNPVEPAFNYNDDYPEEGLNKREYFAAMAMQGLISNLSAYVQVHQKSSGHELIYQTMDTAVIIADALIAELNK